MANTRSVMLTCNVQISKDGKEITFHLPKITLRSVNRIAGDTLPKIKVAGKPFSPRELEIFNLIRYGLCNKEIANDLGIAVRTVKFHVSSILKKAGCDNRVQLFVKKHGTGGRLFALPRAS